MFRTAKTANRQRWKMCARKMTQKKKNVEFVLNRTAHSFHSKRFNFEILNLCGHNNFVWAFFLFHTEWQPRIFAVTYSFASWVNGRSCRFAHKIDTKHSQFSFVYKLRASCPQKEWPEVCTLNFTVYTNRNRKFQYSVHCTTYIFYSVIVAQGICAKCNNDINYFICVYIS